MKVVKCIKYGSPKGSLRIDDIKKPIPKNNEVLIKDYIITVTIADCRVRGFVVPKSFWVPASTALIGRFGFRKTPFRLRPLRYFAPPHFARPGLAAQALIRAGKTSVT